jgi:probable HAF family extracellular repeat protein
LTRLVIAPALAATATLLLGLQTSKAPAVIDLGMRGGPYAFATAINNRQQVVGQSVDAAETRLEAFLWEDGAMRGPSTADLHFEIAQDINDRGEIVGSGRDGRGRVVTLRWDDGVLTELPMPPGATLCGAEAINDRGDIVGACDQVPEWGVLWRRNGGVVGLGPVPDGWFAAPVDINERGAVLGSATHAAGVQQSWIWEDGTVTVITNLPGGGGAPLFLPTALNAGRSPAGAWISSPDARSCSTGAASSLCHSRQVCRAASRTA